MNYRLLYVLKLLMHVFAIKILKVSEAEYFCEQNLLKKQIAE